MKTLFAMHQEQGGRDYQQDAMSHKSFGVAGTVYFVADGMGGYEGGEIASNEIRKTFLQMFIDREDIGSILEDTLYKSNQAIADYKIGNPNLEKMGSTLVAAYITESTIRWISVGDSLLYEVNNCKSIKRINANHSIAGLLELQLKKGEITQKEYDENPNKHMLTSALTGDEIAMIDLSLVEKRKDNHLYILASDGLETLSEIEILEILKKYDFDTQSGVSLAAEGLVAAVISKKKQNQDNVSVIIVSSDSIKCASSSTHTILEKKNQALPTSKPEKDFKKIALIGLIFVFLSILSWLIFDMFISDKKPVFDEKNITTLAVDENESSITSEDETSEEDSSINENNKSKKHIMDKNESIVKDSKAGKNKKPFKSIRKKEVKNSQKDEIIVKIYDIEKKPKPKAEDVLPNDGSNY